MKLTISKNANINYLSRVVDIRSFVPHPNPEYTKLKMASVGGFNLIVSVDMEAGEYVYFPAMSELNPHLLSFGNLYRDNTKNANPGKKGFFENNGRVKVIRLGGTPSEGFLMPLQQLKDWIKSEVSVDLNDVQINIEFDSCEHNGKSFWISKKYIPETRIPSDRGEKSNPRNKKLKRFNKLIEGQFNFHYDTVLLRKEPDAIKPNDLIHISSKWHGTSMIASYVCCNLPKTKKERLISKVAKFFGAKEDKLKKTDSYPEYDYVYSSRSVIKNKNINLDAADSHFYNEDVWLYGFEHVKPYLWKGMTVYAEIVGFTSNGSYIQKQYDYGCRAPRGKDDYKEGVNFKVVVYRVTLTNIDGKVFEFSPHEVQLWCKNCGLTPVTEFYYGYAKDLYPDLPIDDNWSINFMERMANDKNFYMEELSPDCHNKVAHEGIVIKKDDMISRAWKLKAFRFLEGEQKLLDKNIISIEDVS